MAMYGFLRFGRGEKLDENDIIRISHDYSSEWGL